MAVDPAAVILVAMGAVTVVLAEVMVGLEAMAAPVEAIADWPHVRFQSLAEMHTKRAANAYWVSISSSFFRLTATL